jgi:hypothetical protein
LQNNVLKEPPNSNEDGSVLTLLWRRIINDLGIVDRMPSYIARYTRLAERKKLKTLSGLKSDITGETMTWRVFLHLARYILMVKKIKITIELTLPDDTVSSHSVETTFHNDTLEHEKVLHTD